MMMRSQKNHCHFHIQGVSQKSVHCTILPHLTEGQLAGSDPVQFVSPTRPVTTHLAGKDGTALIHTDRNDISSCQF